MDTTTQPRPSVIMAATDQDLSRSEVAVKPRRSRNSGIDRALQVLDCLQRRGRPATAQAEGSGSDIAGQAKRQAHRGAAGL